MYELPSLQSKKMKWCYAVTSSVQMEHGFTSVASEILQQMRKMTGTAPRVVQSHSGPCFVPVKDQYQVGPS